MSGSKPARLALGRLLAARGGEVPYDAMAELIELARGSADVRRLLLDEVETQLWNAERDMQEAWLCVVAGEMGRDGLLALIELLGKTGSDDVAAAAIPALTRHPCEMYEDIKRAINASKVTDQRVSLYGTLEGAVVRGDEGLKRDLTQYARDRVRWELDQPARTRTVVEPLSLLVHLEAPDAREKLDQVKKRHRAKADLRDLEELESALLAGKSDLSLTEAILKDDWRATAANIRKLFHPTTEETRQLQEYVARLVKGKGVH